MKILFVTSRFPWPLDKGDKLRAFNQIRYLSLKHEIILFSISNEQIGPGCIKALEPYCKKIKIVPLTPIMILANIIRHIFSHLPFQCIYFYNKRIGKLLEQFYRVEQPEKIVLQLIRTTEYATLFKKSNVLIDLMDCFSYHYFLRSKSSSFVSSWFYNHEYRRIKKYEMGILKKFRDIIIISEKDKSLLPGNKTHVHVIGNGVDIPSTQIKDKNTDLLFLGNLGYTPNIDAATFILNEILPLLIITDPQISITIAGIDAKKKLGMPAIKNIVILENLQETINVFNDARIFVAPMFLSTGIQNKILEAMAYELPVVTTPNAADALGAVNGKHLLTAVSALEFAIQIRRILYEPGLSEALALNAKGFVTEHCNWKKHIKLIDNIITKNSKVVQAAEV